MSAAGRSPLSAPTAVGNCQKEPRLSFLRTPTRGAAVGWSGRAREPPAPRGMGQTTTEGQREAGLAREGPQGPGGNHGQATACRNPFQVPLGPPAVLTAVWKARPPPNTKTRRKTLETDQMGKAVNPAICKELLQSMWNFQRENREGRNNRGNAQSRRGRHPASPAVGAEKRQRR